MGQFVHLHTYIQDVNDNRDIKYAGGLSAFVSGPGDVRACPINMILPEIGGFNWSWGGHCEWWVSKSFKGQRLQTDEIKLSINDPVPLLVPSYLLSFLPHTHFLARHQCPNLQIFWTCFSVSGPSIILFIHQVGLIKIYNELHLHHIRQGDLRVQNKNC